MYLADGKHKSISELVKIKSYLTGQNPFLWESDRTSFVFLVMNGFMNATEVIVS